MNRPTNMTNYHSHCTFCDGRASMEDFVKEAIRQGFTSYGISSHAPLPFPTRWTMEREDVPDYLHEICRLKQQYAGEIEIYAGMEIDYLDAGSNPGIEYFRQLPLDYRIGSVHLLYDDEGRVVDSDLPAEKFRQMVDKHFQGDVERVVRLYYERSRRMVELGGFDIVGHADKIHYNAAYCRPGILEEPWYDRLVRDYFVEIARRGYQVEINTKAWSELGTFYPDERYFLLLRELGIRVQVNSDAHYPERIASGMAEAYRALHRAGFTSVMRLQDGQWAEIPF